MRRVRWAAAAIEDLDALRAYHAESEPDAAQAMIDRLVLATDWLLDWPHAGREVGAGGWRKWKPRRTAHVLIYRPVTDGIEVSRVRHERENWLADL